MIAFRLNGQATTYDGDLAVSLLSYLRNDRHLTAAKDGCSGQAACGACLVELNGKACLACSTPMSKVTDGDVVTLEGLPETLRRTLGMAFVNRGAVQCGFCTPGFLMRAKVLLQTNPNPTREEVVKAVRPHLCRCTGYVKLVDAILDAATLLPEGNIPEPDDNPRLGSGWPKYGGYERAVGTRPFVNDIDAPGMAHGAIVFSEHPRARVLAIHTDEAADMPGVVRILTADDIPGERVLGLYAKDWPVYIKVGEVTRYIGDALACVVAETEAEARAAAACVKVDYEVLTPLLDMEEAETSPIHIHENGNILLDKTIRRGEPVDEALARCAFTAEATYRTQAVEHAFIEPEATLAVPEAGGVRLYVQSQGIWHDKTDIAALLHVPTPKVTVTLADLNIAPTCSITAPEAGASYEKEDAIVIKGTGSDEDGTIAGAVLKVNNKVVESVTNVPFEYTLAEEFKEPGDVKIVLEVTDNNGKKATSEVSIEILGRFREFTDTRDNKTYKTVKIGNQLWFAENLAYLPQVSPASEGASDHPYFYVYGYNGTDVAEAKATESYKSRGVLYNWLAAGGSMDSKNDDLPSGIQGPCPAGWHVPSEAEWDILYNYVRERIPKEEEAIYWDGTPVKNVSGHLRSKEGWPIAPDDDFPQLAQGGFDTYGFNVLVTGYRISGMFYKGPDSGGNACAFWLPHYDAVTYPSNPGAVNTSISNYKYEIDYGRGTDPSRAYSIRCLQD